MSFSRQSWRKGTLNLKSKFCVLEVKKVLLWKCLKKTVRVIGRSSWDVSLLLKLRESLSHRSSVLINVCQYYSMAVPLYGKNIFIQLEKTYSKLVLIMGAKIKKLPSRQTVTCTLHLRYSSSMNISSIVAREILDSRSNPTVETTITLEDGSTGVAAVPSGASTGSHEAVELRDQDPTRFGGKGVLNAIDYVNNEINSNLSNNSGYDQVGVDNEVVLRDGTNNLGHFGANAVLSVSLAVSKAAAASQQKPYYHYIAELYQQHFSHDSDSVVQLALPTPTFNVLNGGAHTNWQTTDFQEFMVVPHSAKSFTEKLEQGSEIYHALKSVLSEMGLATTVGDEGGFAPKLKDNEHAIELLLKAIEKAGFKPGSEISIALDPATSELYDPETKIYTLKAQNKTMTTQQMIELWQNWLRQYPIVTLEDGLAEDDWQGWQQLQAVVGNETVLVGDDLLVTNPERIQKAIQLNACSALLTKVNQIGTLSEALQAVALARSANWQVIISHRSGETEDTSIADLSVAVGAEYAKMGAPARSERVAKYNRLMGIESELLGS